MNSKNCPLCNGSTRLAYVGMLGYMEGDSFDIYECLVCDASFASPFLSNELLYNYIYDQVDSIPGYMRYDRFAQLVLKVKNPLDVLANLENVYWAVRESLKSVVDKKKVSILEVGSGLGYLTYSLNKAGYKTEGLDLSHQAVKKANERYGEFYEAGDLFVISKERTKYYDYVVMTELIEHVENPKDFIEASLCMLKDGGKLILTTPNKTKSHKDVIWQSDVPPVHLWWLAEKSIIKIADSFSKKCEFIDFTEFTKKFSEYDTNVNMDSLQASLPRLRKDGKVFEGKAVKSLKSKILGVRLHSFFAYIKSRIGKKVISSRSSSMCAIITK